MIEKRSKLFLTCEHAGAQIPARYKKLFAKSHGVLKTHRGSDPGAFKIATEIQKLSKAPFYFTKLSRLVVDMNRSPDSQTALSRWTKALPADEQFRIFSEYYEPYRNLVESRAERAVKKSRVVHLGIHSFSPYLNPNRRGCHIGILFDPKSKFEVTFAEELRSRLELFFPKLGIRMNFPYRGDGDGVTTDLRSKFDSQAKTKNRYAGIEIEFNQAFLRKLENQNSTKNFVKLFYFCVDGALAES